MTVVPEMIDLTYCLNNGFASDIEFKLPGTQFHKRTMIILFEACPGELRIVFERGAPTH